MCELSSTTLAALVTCSDVWNYGAKWSAKASKWIWCRVCVLSPSFLVRLEVVMSRQHL